MFEYYYSDAYVDPETEQIDPSEETTGGELIASSPPLGTSALKLDRERDPFRFVLKVPAGSTIPVAWEQKTVEEVNTDYPDLIGGEGWLIVGHGRSEQRLRCS